MIMLSTSGLWARVQQHTRADKCMRGADTTAITAMSGQDNSARQIKVRNLEPSVWAC